MHGEPRDLHSLELLDLALEEPGVTFQRGEVFGRTPTPRLAAPLWEAAKAVARPKKLGPRTMLMARTGLDRVQAFELSQATLSLLACQKHGEAPLGGLIRMDRTDREEVLQELGCLVALGLFETRRLEQPQRAQAEALRPSHSIEEVYGRRSVPVATADRVSDPALVRRLRSEIERLRGVDDNTLLGLPPRLSADETEAHLRRVIRRYASLAKAHDTGEPARGLAEKLLGEMTGAAERLRSGKGRRASSKVNPKTALQDGKAQLQRGEFTLAAQFFAVARNHEPYNAANLAWLGWAVFNDPSRDLDTRRQRGRRLMEEAERLGRAGGDALFLQARADVLEGELVRAWTRLEELCRANPDHDAGAALLAQVKRDVRKA